MKIPSLEKVFGRDKIEASSKDGASASAPTSNKIETSTYPVSQTSSTAYGDFDPANSIENSSEYQGVGDGVSQKGTTTNDGSPLTGAQAGTALGVGVTAVILRKTGALGGSADTQETINAAGQGVLENAGLSSATANSVLAAAAGDKSAKLDVGAKAANVLTNGAVSEKLVLTADAALKGDRNAQRTLVLDAVNVLTNEASPLAPAVTAVKSAARSAIDDVFPVGSPLRNLASSVGNLINKGTSKNEAPTDSPPIVVSSAGISRLQKARERRDPMFSFDWQAQLPNIKCPNITVSGDTFNFYVEEATVGMPNFQNTDVFREGTRKNFPSFSDSGTLSLVFYEDSDLNATTYIEYWRSIIQNKQTRRYSLPSIYKQKIQLNACDATGKVAGQFEAVGCWPLTTNQISLQSSSSERVIRNVEFSVDSVLYTKYSNGVAVTNSTTPVKGSGTLTDMLKNAGLTVLTDSIKSRSLNLSSLDRFA